MSQQLETHRKNASDLSLGLSHDRIYQKTFEILKNKTGPHHLDFGAGRGVFVTQLRKLHPQLQITAIDLMDKPTHLDPSIRWFAQDLNQTIDIPPNSFDSISAIEIIEHLENPRHVFRELYRVLKPNGHLVLTTPNNESMRSILSYIFRGHFVDFTGKSYPAHIVALNRLDLQHCAQEAGFQWCSWAYSNHGAIPGLTKLSWQKISLGMLNNRLFCDNILAIFKK